MFSRKGKGKVGNKGVFPLISSVSIPLNFSCAPLMSSSEGKKGISGASPLAKLTLIAPATKDQSPSRGVPPQRAGQFFLACIKMIIYLIVNFISGGNFDITSEEMK